MAKIYLQVVFLSFLALESVQGAANIPTTAEVVPQYQVSIDERPLDVQPVKVAAGDDARRWKEMDDWHHSAEIYDTAYFASFDLAKPSSVVVHASVDLQSVKVLPTALHITATVAGRDVTIPVDHPANLTVEINGDAIHSLHLFVDPPEATPPGEHDANVIYFGPGVHETKEGVHVGSGQTLYLAAGAVLKGEPGSGKPVVELIGDHITLRGRGIIDGGDCPTHSRNLMLVRGSDISIEGITFTDSPTWNVPIRQSDRVTVKNVKIFGHRSNSDGIDICNSRDVTVSDCFIRTLDDLVVVKADANQGPVGNVLVQKCVLWNQVAHALSVGAELRDPIDGVRFTDCDVIHDIGREWTLRIYHCDAGVVKNVSFDNIRVEESRKLISLWIGKAVWSRDSGRGHIVDTSFSHISAIGKPLAVELIGSSDAECVDGVTFDDVTRNGEKLTIDQMKQNAFVRNVKIEP